MGNFNEYLEKAKAGDVFAQYDLACCYEDGSGVEADLKEALKWFLESAKKVYLQEDYHLWIINKRPDPLAHIVNLCEKAPELKTIVDKETQNWFDPELTCRFEIMYLLGKMYDEGIIIEQDQEKALYWFDKAISVTGVNTGYGFAMIAEDRVNDLLEMFIDRVDADMLYRYGMSESIVRYLEKAADMGHPEAAYELGELYEFGKRLVYIDLHKAFEYYKKAFNRGCAKAGERLAYFYENGIECEADHEKAFELYSLHMAEGSLFSKVRLGVMYEEGKGVTRDRKKAFRMYTEAADAGSKEAKERLARCYMLGIGVKKDYHISNDLYESMKKIAPFATHIRIEIPEKVQDHYFQKGEGIDIFRYFDLEGWEPFVGDAYQKTVGFILSLLKTDAIREACRTLDFLSEEEVPEYTRLSPYQDYHWERPIEDWEQEEYVLKNTEPGCDPYEDYEYYYESNKSSIEEDIPVFLKPFSKDEYKGNLKKLADLLMINIIWRSNGNQKTYRPVKNGTFEQYDSLFKRFYSRYRGDYMMIVNNITVNAQNSIEIITSDYETYIYIDPFRLGEVYVPTADYILITHEHFDHFSPEDIKKKCKKTTILVVPESMLEKTDEFRSLVADIVTVKPGEKKTIGKLEVETIPAYNEDKPFHPKDNGWVGYILNVEDARIYIAGDTDAVEEAMNVECDIALVPIGGKYTMNAAEAAKLVNKIYPRYVFPTHYGEIVGTDEKPETFKKMVDNDIQVIM
ncbi:MAG: SEL1-like repeat protein [Lachnospiraceae bacterium]|nr:SEL1-like repeat protein [Lachnospiraceae bacterium]